MFTQPAPPTVVNEELFMFIDPAAGGPQSDYAVLTIARRKGIITVRKFVSKGIITVRKFVS